VTGEAQDETPKESNPYHTPVVFQFTMTAQNSGAVNQGVLLAFFQVKKPLFIITTFRFPSLGVDFCHNSLDDVYLWKQRGK
jgi:hypothetical protein